MIDPRTVTRPEIREVYKFAVRVGVDPMTLVIEETISIIEAIRAAADHPTNEIDEGLTSDINTLLEPLR